MKYLKLFNGFVSINEQFDRYEVAVHTTEDDAAFTYFQIQDLYEANDIGKFLPEEKQRINAILWGHESVIDTPVYEKDDAFICFYSKSKRYYLVYALGDYCYAYLEQNRDYMWTYCEIIDESDRLYTLLEELMVKLEK